MILAYKNTSNDIIIRKLRDIRYANGELMYGYYNNITIDLTLNVDLVQIQLQADLFARELFTHRSSFDMKRFLGSYDKDWKRLLHHAYVYDRLKCLYYGMNSNKIVKIPENTFSFPGNILLMQLLSKNNFRYDTADSQPFSLYVNINYGDFNILVSPIFEAYPDLREGMSRNSNIISYVNPTYESIIKGLLNAKEYLKSKKSVNSNVFELMELNSSKIEQFCFGNANPLLNSFLSKDLTKFFFLMPHNESKPESLRFNESVFFSRAVGFVSEQLTIDDNQFYTVARRSISNDIHTREEVYAITGLKTELIPGTSEYMKEYLSVNSMKEDIVFAIIDNMMESKTNNKEGGMNANSPSE